MKACALAYALVRVIEDHLDAAGSDLNAKDTLQDLARIQCAQLDRAGVAVIKPTTPSGQHQQLLAAISAPIPERNAAA